MSFQNRASEFLKAWRIVPADELAAKIRFREYLTALLLMIPALGTVMLTYYGISVSMQEVGGTLVQKGMALAFAICIGIYAWLGWFYLFGLIYRLSGRRLVAALTAAFVYVGSLAAIDAPFNMLAIAGGTAVQMSLADTATAYETRKEAVFKRATIAQRMVPGIRVQGERFRKLERDEIDHGTYSGGKGSGKVSSGFGQIATLLEALVRDLEKGLSEAKLVQDEVAKRLAEMKAQTFRQGPIRPRVESTNNAADRIDDLLGRLEQYDYTASIAATLDSLDNIFPAPTEAASQFEKRQNAELGVIAEMARPVAKSLRTALAELQGLPQASTKPLRPLNAHNAIRTYWRPLFAEWCAALFIDIAPAALIIILTAAWRENERAQPPNAPPINALTQSPNPLKKKD